MTMLVNIVVVNNKQYIEDNRDDHRNNLVPIVNESSNTVKTSLYVRYNALERILKDLQGITDWRHLIVLENDGNYTLAKKLT